VSESSDLLFSQLNLESSLFLNIQKNGYEKCTPIQSLAIPKVLAGLDLAGLAQTGTGKTAAFLIPLIDRILKAKRSDLKDEEKKFSFADWRNRHFILILVPTRELAEQVQQNADQLLKETGLKACSIYGGTGYEKQIENVKNGAEFVVATPGRLIDLYKEHHIDLKQVRAVVFDEADRMFDMGFKDDMKYILSRINRDRQFLVFSATLNFDVMNTAYQFGAEPVEIDISRDQAKAENVKDELLHVGQSDKPMMLLSLIKYLNPNQVIIFNNFKHNTDRIAQFLTANGIPAMGISSLLSQNQRNRVIEQFKAVNNRNVLVATDVAARGLDIKGVDMVINYDLPNDAESYVHRIGRTGRAGQEGRAYSLVSELDVDALARVEAYLKHKIALGWIDDAHLIRDFKPLPSEPRHHREFKGREFKGRDFKGGDGKRFKQHGEKSFDKPRGQESQNPKQSNFKSKKRFDPKQGHDRKSEQDQRHGHGPKHRHDHKHKSLNGHAHRETKHHSHRKHQKSVSSRAPAVKQSSSLIDRISRFFKGFFQGSKPT
jgi:superfamily II DNA/RNA helicase